MDKVSIYSQDPYGRSDENTDIFLDINIWQPYFCEGANLSTKYVKVENDIDVLLVTSEPPNKTNNKAVLIISGWFSVINAWVEIVKEISKTNTLYYYESREKTSAKQNMRIVDYSVERYAQDFDIVVNQLAHKIEDVVVIGSSVGGTMMFNYLANYNRVPFATILTGPQPYIKMPPWPIGQILYNLPLRIFILSIRYAIWHLVKFRINKDKEPEQVEKLLQVMRLAIPKRMKHSVRALTKYNAWDRDIMEIKANVILVGAKLDKLHNVDKTKKIKDTIEKSSYLEYESNSGVHSIDFAKDVVRISSGDTDFVNNGDREDND